MKKIIFLLLTLVSVSAFGQHQYGKTITASGTDNYTCVITVPSPPPNYTNLVIHGLKFSNTNTTTATLNITNISGAGAVALRMWDGDSWEVLTAGQLDVNTVYTIKYSGSYFEVFGAGSSGGGGGTWGTITGTLSDQTDLQNALNAKQATITFGTGVQTALGVNIGSAGAPVLFNGAGGTPSSLTGTNITGIPESGVTNLTSDLAAKQATLVSGTNIKTVNSNSLLGSGNVAVGDALLANPLSQFASTTSSQFAGVISDEVGTGLVALSNPVQNTQTGSYTAVLSDQGKTILINSATANNFTLPLHASVAYPYGTQIRVRCISTGQTTIVLTGGVTGTTTAGNLLIPIGGEAFFTQDDDTYDTWYISNGNPSAALTETAGLIDFVFTGSPTTALLNAVGIQASLNGISSVTTGDLVSASATDTFGKIAAVASGSYLRSAGTSTLPIWSTLILPNAATSTRLVFASATNTYGEDSDLTFSGGNTLNTAKVTVATGVTNAAGWQHERITTGSISGGSTALVTVTWDVAFTDTNYTGMASVEDSTTSSLSLSVVHIESKSTTTMTVRILNNAVGSLTGTVNCMAIHD